MSKRKSQDDIRSTPPSERKRKEVDEAAHKHKKQKIARDEGPSAVIPLPVLPPVSNDLPTANTIKAPVVENPTTPAQKAPRKKKAQAKDDAVAIKKTKSSTLKKAPDAVKDVPAVKEKPSSKTKPRKPAAAVPAPVVSVDDVPMMEDTPAQPEKAKKSKSKKSSTNKTTNANATVDMDVPPLVTVPPAPVQDESPPAQEKEDETVQKPKAKKSRKKAAEPVAVEVAEEPQPAPKKVSKSKKKAAPPPEEVPAPAIIVPSVEPSAPTASEKAKPSSKKATKKPVESAAIPLPTAGRPAIVSKAPVFAMPIDKTKKADKAKGKKAAPGKKSSSASVPVASTSANSGFTEERPIFYNDKWYTSQELLASVWNPQKIIAKYPELIKIKKGAYTTRETMMLRLAVEKYEKENKLTRDQLVQEIVLSKTKGLPKEHEEFWKTMANAVPGRMLSSVFHCIRRNYDPNAHKGLWTEEEDEQLKDAVGLLGEKWNKIAEEVGRTQMDVKDRWVNHLRVKMEGRKGSGAWTAEEERNLCKAVKKVTKTRGKYEDCLRWTEISKKLGTRSRQQCSTHWNNVLLPKVKAADGQTHGWNIGHDGVFIRKLKALKDEFVEADQIDFRKVSAPELSLFGPEQMQRRFRCLTTKARKADVSDIGDLIDSLKAPTGTREMHIVENEIDEATMVIPEVETLKSAAFFKAPRKPSTPTAFKSKEYIDTEDEEDDEPTPAKSTAPKAQEEDESESDE